MYDRQSNADGERRNEGSPALLHGKHQDGDHQLGSQKHFHHEATSCADTIAHRILSLEWPREDSRYQTGSCDSSEELDWNHTDEADPVEGA